MKHKITLLLIVMMIILSGCSLRKEHKEDVEYVVAGCVQSLENNILTINVAEVRELYRDDEDEDDFNSGWISYGLTDYIRSFDLSGIEIEEELQRPPYIVKVHVKNGDAIAIENTGRRIYKGNSIIDGVDDYSTINFTDKISTVLRLYQDYSDYCYYEMRFDDIDNLSFDKLIIESEYGYDAYIVDLDVEDNSNELLLTNSMGTYYIIFYNTMKNDFEVYRLTNADLYYEGDGYIEATKYPSNNKDKIYFYKNNELIDIKKYKEYDIKYTGERYFYNTIRIDEELEVLEDVTR